MFISDRNAAYLTELVEAGDLARARALAAGKAGRQLLPGQRRRLNRLAARLWKAAPLFE